MHFQKLTQRVITRQAKFLGAGMAVLIAAGAHWPAFGGTVITANLPAGAAIINISGTQDGAAGDNDDKSYWYQPFYTGGAAGYLQFTFQPGTYTFRLVDPADAAQLFPALTSAQTNQIYTAWTFNSPWITSYAAFDSAATNNPALPQLFDGASGTNYGNGGITLYGSPAAAYNAAIADGSYALIRTGTNGYDSKNFTNSYTFTNAETLVFAVPDFQLSDNAGGVSVLVTHLVSDLAVNWSTVAGGGGASSDGTLTIQGTAGQPDTGRMSDGTYTVKGGFWSIYAVPTPGAPVLSIKVINHQAVFTWPPAATGWILQTNATLAPGGWGDYLGPVVNNSATNSAPPLGNLFLRLKHT